MKHCYLHTYALSLIVCLTVGLRVCYAQSERPNFHYLSAEEGLSQASNNFIYHDSKGFVWLSSIDGLNRFDGKTVKVYKSIAGDSTSLLGNIITSNFYEDAQANLWFTTYEGIHCYLRAKDHFRHFQVSDEQGVVRKADYHAFHLDQADQLWVRIGIGPTAKLHLFHTTLDTSRVLCPLDGQYNFPVLDEAGRIEQVVASNISGQAGITIFNTKTPAEVRSAFAGEPGNMPALNVFHLNQVTADEWWLSTNQGLVHYKPQTDDYRTFSTFQEEDIGYINSSLCINDSILWAASSRYGVLVFDCQQSQFVGQIPAGSPQALGLQIRRPNQLYKDHEDNVWISSFSSGVNYTNLRKPKFAQPATFRGQNIHTLYETRRGEVFCSYGAGQLAYYPTTEEHDSPELLTTTGQSILFFFEDSQQQLWATTINQLLRWQRTERQFVYAQGLPHNILYVYTLRDGRILFATYGGIYEWEVDAESGRFVPFTALGKRQGELVTSIYETQARQLFLAVDAARVLILEETQGQYRLRDQIEGIGYAKDYHETAQAIWMATSTGILRVEVPVDGSDVRTTAAEGAPNEGYYCIIPDEQGSFWLSCNRGVIRYFPQEKRHHHYTLMDGLQDWEYNTNAFLKTRTGEIWLGGTKGVNHFQPADIRALPYAPLVQFTRLQVNDEPFVTTTQIEELSELILDYNQNTLSFDFVALEYSDPAKNQLQYQLENHEETWVDAKKNGFARYSNLPPGEYRFKVKGANSDGVWNEQPRVLDIVILKPWWQTWWFYVLSLLTVSALTYKLIRYRLEQALKIERLRVKISSDLHDEVGSVLAGLTMQTDILAFTASAERKTKLERISEMSRSAMSRMRDTVWAIDARKDSFKDLLDRIREHASETLEWKNIGFHLDMTDVALDKKLPTQVRQDLYLICKEAITNAAKHSNGDQLHVSFEKYERNGLKLVIYDNGRLTRDIANSAGLGLSNMHLRAKNIGAQLDISSERGFMIRVLLSSL